MAAKAFGWIGATRRQAVVTKLLGLFEAWLKDWAVVPTMLDGRDGAEVPANGDFQGFEARGRFAFHIEGDLAAALTGLEDGQGGELAAHLRRTALQDLARRFAETGQAPVMEETAALPEALADPRWGACGATIEGGGLCIRVWLDRTAATRWAPPAASPTRGLVGRAEAAGPARAHLKATLDLGEISLEELHGLASGDVIATQASLARPFAVAVTGSESSLFHGHLGQRDGCRALRLLATDVSESL